MLVVLPTILIPIPIRAPRVQFLPTAEASPGLPGAARQRLGGCLRPSTQLWETPYWFCIFCIIFLLIINIFSVISAISKTFSIQFVHLSLFLLFPSSGWS